MHNNYLLKYFSKFKYVYLVNNRKLCFLVKFLSDFKCKICSDIKAYPHENVNK